MSQSETLKALNRVSRRRFSLDTLPDVIVEINSSSDRTVAIVFATLVEDSLRAALMRQMNHLNKDEERDLFDGDGPISTASSKIQLCYALRIIDNKQKYDLNLINKIRNAFAHGFLGVTFDMEQVKNVCKLLKIPERWSDHTTMPSRQRYVFTCATLWLKFGDFAEGFVYNRDRGLQLFTRDQA